MLTGRFVLYLIIMLVAAVPLSAQEFKWGKISDEELLMPGIAEDPEANAVVLFDRSIVKITPDFRMEMDVHKRVKILREAGKEFANVSIYFYEEDDVKHLEAVCYTPEGKKIKLDKKQIFEESSSRNWKKKVFTIPGVQAGAVFEYKYQLLSKYINRLEPWLFQGREFTRFSQIEVFLPAGFAYTAAIRNMLENDYYFTQEDVRNPYDIHKKASKFTWTVYNKPGIKEEPHMTAFHDYLASIHFQLVSFQRRDGFKINFSKTWDQMADAVWSDYKDFVGQDGGLKNATRELIGSLDDPLEKMKRIYDFVREEVITQDKTILWGTDFKKPADVHKSKEGGINEKNMLLINMLKKAGFDARPLLISTRSNGLIDENWITLQQFNRVIAYVRVDNKDYFLNSASRYCPFGQLTPEYDVGQGLLITERTAKIIPIKPLKDKNRLDITTDAFLAGNGNLQVQAQLSFHGLNGVLERARLEKKDMDKYLKEKIQQIHADAVLDTFSYADMDSCYKPLQLNMTFSVTAYAQESGNLAYFPIPLLSALKKNPFVREKRNFPVDYEHEYDMSETVKITLADGYVLEEKPETRKSASKSVSFNKIYFTGENQLECRRTFRINNKQVNPIEYERLRQVYEVIVSSDLDQIVLAR